MEECSSLESLYDAAESALIAMDEFHNSLPGFLRFPPHPPPAEPVAQRVDGNDDWTPPFASEQYAPQTEKDIAGAVPCGNISFRVADAPAAPPAANREWAFSPKADESDISPPPASDREWAAFQRRWKLVEATRKSIALVHKPPQLTLNGSDMWWKEHSRDELADVISMFRCETAGDFYPMQPPWNPLYWNKK